MARIANGLVLSVALGVASCLAATKGPAQETRAEKGEAGSDAAILARPPQAALPPLNCWRCFGPPPSNYCLPGFGARGYLYYGTYPYDDDWFNGFDDCPGGACGNAGAALGLGWIQLHNAVSGPRLRLEHRTHRHGAVR